jgi:HEAT repeat protein
MAGNDELEPDHTVSRQVDMVERAAGERDIKYLLGALKSQTYQVRLAAVQALGEVGGAQAALALLGVARDHPGERPDVRIAAMRALERFHGPERYASILEEFVTGDNRKVVSAARLMLSRVDPGGYPRRLAARGCLDHGAIGVYGKTREPSALPLLGRFLSDLEGAGDLAGGGQWGRAYAAVKALGNIGGPEAVETLRLIPGWLQAAGAEGPFRKERLGKLQEAARLAVKKAKEE